MFIAVELLNKNGTFPMKILMIGEQYKKQKKKHTVL